MLVNTHWALSVTSLGWETLFALCEWCLFSRQILSKDLNFFYVSNETDLQNTKQTNTKRPVNGAAAPASMERAGLVRKVLPLLFVVSGSPGGNMGEISEIMTASWAERVTKAVCASCVFSSFTRSRSACLSKHGASFSRFCVTETLEGITCNFWCNDL